MLICHKTKQINKNERWKPKNDFLTGINLEIKQDPQENISDTSSYNSKYYEIACKNTRQISECFKHICKKPHISEKIIFKHLQTTPQFQMSKVPE